MSIPVLLFLAPHVPDAHARGPRRKLSRLSPTRLHRASLRFLRGGAAHRARPAPRRPRAALQALPSPRLGAFGAAAVRRARLFLARRNRRSAAAVRVPDVVRADGIPGRVRMPPVRVRVRHAAVRVRVRVRGAVPLGALRALLPDVARAREPSLVIGRCGAAGPAVDRGGGRADVQASRAPVADVRQREERAR